MRLNPWQLPAAALLLWTSTSAFAENWPSWRGVRNDGISHEKNLPAEFGPEKNFVWKVRLPGPAGSTPVVWGDHIFLTSVNDAGDLLLMALDSTGKELWQRKVSSGNKNVRSDEGNSASNSPVTDGKFVWSMMADGMLACFDFAGNEIWKVDLQERYGKFTIQFGMTSTPVYDEGVLYLQLIHGEGEAATREACVVALEGATGKQIWRVDRPSDAYAENEHSYASPIIYQDDQRKYLLTHGADYVIAHRLNDGSEIWRCGELNRKGNYDATLRFVSSPVAVPGLIVVPTAKRGPVLALRPDGQGNITEKSEFHVWNWKKTPDVPSPLIDGNLVYLCMENGDLHVLEAATGKEVYIQRTERDRHRASPVLADGKLYLCARNGVVTVVKTGREFEVLATNNLGEDISSSPAIANGTLYLRTYQHLWAFRQK